MSFDLEAYVPGIFDALPFVSHGSAPWEMIGSLAALVTAAAARAGVAASRPGEAVFVHPGATIEPGAVVKPPIFIADGCFVASHAYLRGGVLLASGVTVGPGCEVKSSLVLDRSVLAHFNFVGDSLIGRGVNLEAGAVIANRWNERADPTIAVFPEGRRIALPVTKFGAVIGDAARIGANAVLSPGTLLPPGAVVGRLQLVDQAKAPGYSVGPAHE